MSANLTPHLPFNLEMSATGQKTVIAGHGRIPLDFSTPMQMRAKTGFTAGVLRMVFLFTIAILATAMGVGDTTAWAQEVPCPASPNYPDFSANGSCLKTNGTAMLVLGESNVLRITSSAGNQTGSAWYVTPQTVNNGFTTTFQFQFTYPSTPPADGIAFVIQNSSTTAIGYTGGNGGAIGYGDADGNRNPSQGSGIPNSLAIEFDTYQNSWDPQAVNNSVNHVAIQSCGTGPNTSHHGYLCGGGTGPNSTLGNPVVTANMADGAVHSVTITYFPACSTCTPATVANIQVVLDGVNLYPNGVAVDLSSIGLSDGGTAYVGFTGATGGDSETQDITSWMFSPTQQGQQIDPNNPASLTQSFVSNNAHGQHQEFDFDYSVSNNGGDLTFPNGTPTPFVSTGGVNPLDWASIVKGTAMADAPCLTAAGQTVCAVNTLTCSTSTNTTPAGLYCPQSSARNVLFIQQMDLNLNQPGITNGILTIPAGYAPGIAMAPDVLISGAQCNYPSGEPLATQLCPQSILTQLEDPTPRGGGTGTTTNSSYVFFCCQPEWQTTPTIPLWTNSASVPASFTSVPPATPNPDTNSFHAAQGASVVVGAEPRGTMLDTTYPLPAEQTLNNSTPCPALGDPPSPWSTQNPQPFSVSGLISTYDNNGTASPLVEGAYDAHYFSVDCDASEELVFPPSLDVHPGTPGANVATFKTVPFNLDTTKPSVTSITLSSPGYYAQNSAATATVTCTDPSSPTVTNFFSGIAMCAMQTFNGNQQTVTTSPISLSTSTIGTQTFTASATDAAGNTSPAASATYQVVGSADLATGMIGNLFVRTGMNLTYYIAVANKGPNTANLVTITDTLPMGTTFVSSGYATESCSFSGSQPLCSITPPTNSCGSVAGSCSVATLPAWTKKNPIAALVQIIVNVNAKANTTLTDRAVVSQVNSDPNLNNNTTSWSTFVTK